jgi:adhesin/invasin
MASTYHGTVHFSSTDFAAQLPDDYTFGSGDGGTHTFDVTLQTSGLQGIGIQDTSTASLASILNMLVEDGSGGSPSGGGSHRPDYLR